MKKFWQTHFQREVLFLPPVGTPFPLLQDSKVAKATKDLSMVGLSGTIPNTKHPSKEVATAKAIGMATAAVARTAKEGVAKVFPPPGPVNATQMGEAKVANITANVANPLANVAQPNRLRACLPWWQKHAPQFVINLICKGVEPHFQGEHLNFRQQKKSEADIKLAMEVMEEYVKLGAAKEVDLENSKYLVPWFVITKTEGDKIKNRLISDCREINQSLNPQKFRLDHWKEIFPVLEPKMWAVKIDLQNAYFHLPLSNAIKNYIRMEIGPKVFQMEGACFGLSTLPYLWTQIMHVFLKRWRKLGMLIFIYLDDILLLAKNRSLAEKQTKILVQDLEDSGMLINHKKSKLEPCQEVEHLGFLLNLEKGVLLVPDQKLKNISKEMGKFLVQKEMSCRKAAAILGQLRSFLTALPCLRAFSDLLVKFTDQHRTVGWDKKVLIPSPLQDQCRRSGSPDRRKTKFRIEFGILRPI